MGFHIKRFILMLLLLSVSAQAQYIRRVVINGDKSPDISRQFKGRFEGTIGTEPQIQQMIANIKREGFVRQLTYRLQPTLAGYELMVTIQQNPTVQSIIFENAPPIPYSIRKHLKTKVGKQLNFIKLNDDIAMLNQALKDQGFILSSIYSVQTMPDQSLVVRFRSPIVSDIVVSGFGDVPEFYVYRDLSMRVNQPLNQRDLDRDYEQLVNLPAFLTVSSPRVEWVSSDNVRVHYDVATKNVNRVDVGIEELEDNLGVAVFAKLRTYHTFIYSDFFDIQTQIGYLNQLDFRRYHIQYGQPWLFNKYSISSDIQAFTTYRSEVYQQNSRSYNTIRSGMALKALKRFKFLNMTIGSGLRYERVYPQSGETFPAYDLRSIRLLLEHKRPKTPHQSGFQTNVNYDLGGDVLGHTVGGVTFSRFNIQHARYYPLTKTQEFAMQFFGGLYKKQSLIQTFETEKFSLGGANSLRGYKEFAFYGNYRLSTNLEWRQMWTPNSQWVAFIDAGYIFDHFSNWTDQFHIGYGVGVRFLHAFIPLRVDLAYGDEVMIHLGLAETF